MKLTKEQIEAIALREYPCGNMPREVEMERWAQREALIKGMEMMQEQNNDLHEQIRVLQADKEIRDANQERLENVNRELTKRKQMKLTGKAKNLFEAWCEKDTYLSSERWEKEHDDINIDGTLIKFRNLPESMQWGVLYDFSLSTGYEMSINAPVPWSELDSDEFVVCINKRHGAWMYVGNYEDMSEARKQAVIAFNDLINKG